MKRVVNVLYERIFRSSMIDSIKIDIDCPILLPWSVYYFSSHRAENNTFPPGDKTGMWHFRPRREEK